MWLKVSDDFWRHDKLDRCSLAASGLWVRALSWCGERLNNGFVPEGALGKFNANTKLAEELVNLRLWEPTPGGWVFHDWLDCQLDGEEAKKKREALSRERSRAGKSGALARQNGSKQLSKTDDLLDDLPANDESKSGRLLNGNQANHQAPLPETPQVTRSQTLPAAAATPAQVAAAAGLDQECQQAIELLTNWQVSDFRAGGGHVKHTKGLRRSVAERLVGEHGEALRRLHADHPDWEPVELAAKATGITETELVAAQP